MFDITAPWYNGADKTLDSRQRRRDHPSLAAGRQTCGSAPAHSMPTPTFLTHLTNCSIT